MRLLSLYLVLALHSHAVRAGEPTTNEQAIARSIELLRGQDKETTGRFYRLREEAAATLGAIGPSATNAVPALIEALNDEAPRVQWAAAAALGNIGSGAKTAVPALIKHMERMKLLGASDEEDIKALGKIGAASKPAIPLLVARMRNFSLTDVTKETDTTVGRLLYVRAGSLIRIAEGLRDNVDTQSIPDLESIVLVLEDYNFPPRIIRRVREPLESLKAEVAAGRGPPPTADEKARCWNLLVQIEGEDLDGKPVLGSGIIFGRHEDQLYIATAKHVVRGELSKITKIAVRTPSLLPGETLPAELTTLSTPGLDLAVLIVRDLQKYKMPLDKIPFDRLGKPQSLRTNDQVYALGLPVAQVKEPLQPDKFMEADVAKLLFRSKTVRGGYSGGALFNANWQLVGMIRADEPPFAHAIAIDQILVQLKDWGYPVNLVGPTR